MKILKIFILFCLFLMPIASIAQAGLQLRYRLCTECPQDDAGNGPYTYEAETNYETRDIESDYDMRVTTGTKYHQGIDYLPRSDCRGDGILAVEAGTVSFIHAGGNLKSIAITNQAGTHAFVYMHIFRNGAADNLKSGNFVLKRIGASSNYAIIDLEFDNGPNTPKGRALAATANQLVDYNNVSYTTTNQVQAGELIAPIGSSGGPPGMSPHLHLALVETPSLGIPSDGRNNDRSIDAWTELAHASNHFDQRIRSRRNANFSDNICEHPGPGDDGWGHILPSYTNNTKNCIEIEVQMQNAGNPPGDIDPNTPGVQLNYSRYENTVMDQEEVELEIRKTGGGVFTRAVGSNFECRFVINPIGPKTIYPTEIINNYGSPTVNGISPFTYRDGVAEIHPHDYYFFSDFHLRLDKDDALHDSNVMLANFPWDAKYPDGNYEVRSRVLDVDGNVDISNSVLFDIDNFKPFIRQVGVNFDQIGVTAYWNQWTPTKKAGELQLGNRVEGGIPSPDPNIPPAPGPLTIYVIASESMSWLKAEIPDLTTGLKTGTLIDPETNKWKIDFGTIPGLAWDACYKIEFTGKDLANNNLMDFQIGAPISCNEGITKKVLVEVNKGLPTWVEGPNLVRKDEVHRFLIQRCTTCHQLKGEMPAAPESNFDCDELAESISLDINYASSLQSSDGSISLSIDNSFEGCITWYDIDHNEIYEGPQITHLLPGVYCYEIKQECCFISNCVEVGTCQMVATATPHHPSAPGVSDGSVTLSSTGGNEPLSYLWNNGATTAAINNLGIGTYTVTITDEFHCGTVTSTNLINCPPILIDLNEIVFPPSACDATDGSIKINGFSAQTSGGMPPYTYHWEDENNNIIALGNGTQSNLAAGTYCNIATDALGCTGSECFNLIPDHYPTLEELIYPSCLGQSNGRLTVTALSSLPGFYTFTWDDGVEDSGDVLSIRENLSVGTYCVTVTSEVNFCTVVKCFDVPSVVPNGPLSETHSIINPCPDANNGQIVLAVSGGFGPYQYDWTDLIVDTKNRVNLSAGTYTVKVTDYCGSILIKEFTLTPITIFKTLSDPGCAGLGQVEVSLIQGTGNPPYSVSWSNGSNNYIASDLASGEYCVSVFDALGCMASKCLNLENKEYHITTVNSCVGMSDGIITLDIFNPDEEYVFIHLDGLKIYSNLAATTAFTVDIPSLAGIVDYNIDVVIGDCIYPTTKVRISNDQIELVYDHYDDPENECWYKDACKGNVIPNSYTVQPPFFDFDNGIANIFSCKVPIYCGYNFIENMDFDKYTVRAAEYESILLRAADLFSNAYMSKLLEDFKNKKLKPCEKVRYCSATMEIMSVIPTLAPNQQVQDDGNGCFSLDCTPSIPWLNNNFCLTDPQLNPPIFFAADPTVSEASCNPATMNLYQLIVWEDDLKAAFPDIVDKDLYKNYINPYRVDPRAKCMDVIFCQRDFSVLWSTNIDDVHCDDYAQSPYQYQGDCMQGDLNITGCQYWICANPDDDNIVVPEFQYIDNLSIGLGLVPQTVNIHGEGVIICPDFPGHFFTTPENDEYIKVTNGCTDGEMINFATAISDGLRFPKGITKCGNTFNFMDYSFKSISDRLWELPETEYLIDDWDSGQIVLIKKVENGIYYSVDCHSDMGWSRAITSNTRLKISYFEKDANSYVVGGEFLGNLNFQSTNISTQYNNAGFIIRISPQGELLNYNIIRNLNPQKPLVFVRGTDGVHIVGRSSNQPLTVDGTVYPIPAGYLTDMRVGANESSITSNLLAMDTSLAIVRAQRSSDNSRITYILQGTGKIQYSGQQVITTTPQDLLIVTCNASGNVLWVKEINGQNIVGQDFNLSYAAGSNLILGLTYHNAISVEGQVRVSNGNTDILLVRFNEVGEVIGKLNYGTAYGESISKMFYADSILYFGGEFEGDTISRKIGTHIFLMDSSVVSMPYMSFISEASFTQEARGASNRFRNYSDKVKPNPISIYPNPFSKDLTLRVEASQTEQIYFRVYDEIGLLISEQTHQTALGVNEYSILTSQFTNGVYIIQVLTESGKTWNQKVVKN